MGSGKEPWLRFSVPLASWIAESGYHLLTGAGQGVMAAACEAFCKVETRRGLCLGVVPSEQDSSAGYRVKAGYPNQWVELSIVSPLSTYDGHDPNQITRNYINILTSHVVVAIPGSIGTRNEVDLAVRFEKPVILFGSQGMFTDFPESVARATELEQVQRFIQKHLPFHVL
jgi:uncharacterized protein (TIGR00725 family)